MPVNSTVTSNKGYVAPRTADGNVLGFSTADPVAMLGATPVVQRTGAVQAAAPAGGTGATAGAYDTAVNRDAMIALVNEMRLALIGVGLIKGSA
jgi:hypothetical protein